MEPFNFALAWNWTKDLNSAVQCANSYITGAILMKG